ncbi:MAG: helix-turn-helix transcriptional regulator [Caulobacteraceae bacterium]|nr:helix-turn-helix transcriptional regulator [Caulobacteraceae bacterium]
MINDEPELLNPYFMPLIREKLGFTQAETARRIGLSLRAYSDLENRKTPLRRTHLMAMRLLTLEEAVARQDRSVANITVRELADDFAQLPD